MPFRWLNTCQDVMLATEVAQRRPKCLADYEEIARVLSPVFFGRQKSRCALRASLISKHVEEDKKAFPAKRRQRHAKVNFGDDCKRETSNR